MTRNSKTKTKNLRSTGSRQEAVESVLIYYAAEGSTYNTHIHNTSAMKLRTNNWRLQYKSI